MKDDDNTPQPQTATAPVIASLQQQADASQAAANASIPEDASAKSRDGFDTALHSDNSAPVLLGPGSHNATAPVLASSQQQTGVSQRMAEASSTALFTLRRLAPFRA